MCKNTTRSRFGIDGRITLFFFLLALLIRLPKLQTVPGFHGNELNITLELVRGNRFPLYNQHPHIGALANYIYALGFWTLGMHYWVPRFLTVILGSATVSLLYLLGKRLFERRTAVLAAGLMSVSLYHVFFISHVPWSNCLTPFFTVAMMLSLYTALEKQSIQLIILSGFLFGLALQTHLSVITLAPALLIVFLCQSKERLLYWLKLPSFYLTIPAIILGCANLFYYHFFGKLKSVEQALVQRNYAFQEHPNLSSYLSNTESAWTLLVRLLSGSIETEKLLQAYWKNPVFLCCAVVLAMGFLLLIRRKPTLLLFFAFPMILIPLLNKAYDFCKFGRYLGFEIPICSLIIAVAAVWMLDRVKHQFPKWKSILFAIWLLLPIGYFAHHLIQLSRTYAVLESTDTMRIFVTLNDNLAHYDKKMTLLMLDQSSYKARQLQIFLQTDGWHSKIMADTKNGDVGNLNLTKLNQQIKQWTIAQKNRRAIAIISPLTLKVFLSQTKPILCAACLSSGSAMGNVYQVHLSSIYYAFEVVPEDSPQAGATPDVLTGLLLKMQPLIPDDLHLALLPSRNIQRKQTLLNPHVPPEELNHLASNLNSFCKKIPDSMQSPKSRICRTERLRAHRQ